MPHAVTHFLISVILLSLFRDYFIKNKKTFPAHYLFIGGLAGLLPDMDIAVFYTLSFFGFTMQEIHRTFSHNLFVPLIFVFLAFLFYSFKNKELGEHHLRLKNIFFVIAFGIFVHLLLDMIIAGGIKPLYPLFSYSISLNLIDLAPISWRESLLPSLDALLLILWMVYLEVKHKISSFL